MTLHERLAQLIEGGGVEPSAQQLIWAAYDGEESLAGVVAGDAVELPELAEYGNNPQPVWLSSVKVEGFRGIGPATELLLTPGPGSPSWLAARLG